MKPEELKIIAEEVWAVTLCTALILISCLFLPLELLIKWVKND